MSSTAGEWSFYYNKFPFLFRILSCSTFSHILYLFPCFIPYTAFYPLTFPQFHVLSPLPRFTPFAALYPLCRALPPFPRFIPYSVPFSNAVMPCFILILINRQLQLFIFNAPFLRHSSVHVQLKFKTNFLLRSCWHLKLKKEQIIT